MSEATRLREDLDDSVCLAGWWNPAASYMNTHVCHRPKGHGGRHTCHDAGCRSWRPGEQNRPKLKVGDIFFRTRRNGTGERWEVVDEPFWEQSAIGEQWWYPSRLTLTLNHPESEVREAEQ